MKVLTDAQQTPIERIYIRLTNEDGVTQIDEDFPTEQFVLTAAEYVHTFALPFEYPSGTYNVDFIFIKDRAENINNYSASISNQILGMIKLFLKVKIDLLEKS